MRPTVDVVVPFAGSPDGLRAVAQRLATLELREGDTVTLVDNRPDGEPVVDAPVRVLPARGEQSSYFARNRGAEAGSADWLLFIDGDVRFEPDLIDALFDPPPGERIGVLAGEIEDVVVTDGPVARWIERHEHMSQRNTLHGPRPYAQTAHAAVRRDAFEAVGGFTEGIRSGGDADLCFRIADAGWAIEGRPAAVRHEARATLRPLLGQLARHGSGAAWIDRRYPGSFPATERPVGLVWWLVRRLPGAAAARVRGDRDGAVAAVIEPLWLLAITLGRRIDNAPPSGKPSALDRWLR